MIADAIRLLLQQLPLVLIVAALLCATLTRGISGTAERYLAWLLLLAVGAEGIWGGVFHVFFQTTAAAFIGWQVSPFQFEIGIADIAIGVLAVLSFWRGLEFKSAVVVYVTVFYAGLAFGHVHQMVTAGNTSPGNFGALLAITVVKLVMLPALLLMARRERSKRPEADRISQSSFS